MATLATDARGARIAPCLWFDDQAEQAAQLYVGIFPSSRIVELSRYSEVGRAIHQKDPGSVMAVAFELDGQPFTALNGGSAFTFSEAVSLQIRCQGQAEVDHYWYRLIADGGREQPCGWLKDRFGLSWQVVPSEFHEMMRSADGDRVKRVTEAMFQMTRLDIAALQRAFSG